MSWHRETQPTTTEQFLARYPEYASTQRLDQLRETEYAYLDDHGHVYLDYTGAGLAATAQYRAHHERMLRGCFGNPHSSNPTSTAATELVEQARAAVLTYLNADPSEYAAIFTANATGAARLVGESYPFDRWSQLVLTFDNHNSVNGIREFARARRARTRYVPLRPPELRVDEAEVRAALRRSLLRRAAGAGRFGKRQGLFAYPAQSNFTGVRHPMSWVELAHDCGYDVLLDAAAYLPTGTLDLGAVRPDFVTVSWYKLFGFPTGVGCLVAHRDALSRLHRPWFSGGTVQAVSVRGDWHSMAPDEAAFEDGTLNFLTVPDVAVGLSWLTEIGVDVISRRVRCLTGWLLERLTALRHNNGAPLVRIYGPTDTADRGGTVTFNFLDPDGTVIDERLVEQESAAAMVSLRTGCFCNPGAGEGAFDITSGSLGGELGDRSLTIDQYLTRLGLPSGGAIRVSFGVASTFGDVERFLDFAERTYLNRPGSVRGLPPRMRC